jgi:hypothetical protein
MGRTPVRQILVALSFVLVACTTSQTARTDEAPRRDAFLWLRNVDGFNTIDDEHVVLRAGSKAALVKTFGYCDGLRFAETIAIDAPLDYLDEKGVGHIVYRRGPYDRARCAIDRIVAVKDMKEAKAIVAAEKAEKAKAKQS